MRPMAKLDYELIDVRRINVGTRTARKAVLRQAYHPDRLYAWQGRRDQPTREWMQQAMETRDEFFERVKRDLERFAP